MRRLGPPRVRQRGTPIPLGTCAGDELERFDFINQPAVSCVLASRPRRLSQSVSPAARRRAASSSDARRCRRPGRHATTRSASDRREYLQSAHRAAPVRRSTRRARCRSRSIASISGVCRSISTYRHAGDGQRRHRLRVRRRRVADSSGACRDACASATPGFPDDPKICNAHGTAVAGAIAGATLGVAPNAEIVDVKMVQCDKLRGTIKAIVDGARWVDRRSQAASGSGGRELVVHRRHVVAHSRARQRRGRAARGRHSGDRLGRQSRHRRVPRLAGRTRTGTIVVGASASRHEQVRDGTHADASIAARRAPRTARASTSTRRATRCCCRASIATCADLAAVERHVDVGGLRERRGGAVPRDASERDARPGRRRSSSGTRRRTCCAIRRRRSRECSTSERGPRRRW